MKKFILTAFVAVAVATSAFSADFKDVSKISKRILYNFSSEFSDANDVTWTLRPTFAKASFILENKRVDAFYDFDGTMIGTSKAVTIDQMPVNVKRVFAKKYADYTVKETIHFEGADESAFFISAANSNRSIVLKVSHQGLVSLFSSEKKS